MRRKKYSAWSSTKWTMEFEQQFEKGKKVLPWKWHAATYCIICYTRSFNKNNIAPPPLSSSVAPALHSHERMFITRTNNTKPYRKLDCSFYFAFAIATHTQRVQCLCPLSSFRSAFDLDENSFEWDKLRVVRMR